MVPQEKLAPPLWFEQLIEWSNELKITVEQLRKKQIEQENVHVRIDSTKKGPQYYLLKKGQTNGIYISKSRLDYVKKLIQQEYNRKLLDQTEKCIKLTDKFIKSFTRINPIIVYEDMSEQRQKLITPITLNSSLLIKNWKQANSNSRKIQLIEGRIFKTLNGELVRSKSEVIIANILRDFKVPYKYEEPLQCGSKTLYPDFTCLNIRTHKEIIWEHLGLMDSQDYVAKNVNKISTYEKYGYFLGKKLIITMENREIILTPQRIENIIKEFLI